MHSLSAVGQLPDQIALFNPKQVQDLISSSIEISLAKFFASKELKSQEVKIKKYWTREELKDLLHTSYPTISRYTKMGILKPMYFGRKPLFDDEDLKLALPLIKSKLQKRIT